MIRVSTLRPPRELWTQSFFWLCFFLFEWLNTGAYLDNYQQSLCQISVQLPLLVVAGYWHLLVTVRRFLLHGRMTAFWISLIAGLFVFGVLRRAISYNLIYPIYYQFALAKPFWYAPKILAEAMQLHLVVALFVAVDLVRHALKQQTLSETYRREKVSAEYRLLQSQVQPHFLFNTLNNLTSVSIQQPDKMPNLLQRLAGLLSYQLHESHKDSVPLSKEIAYLQDYISLEQIRYGERLDIQTNFNYLSASGEIRVPPLLLLPFVENAFKHGAAQTEGACWIQINLSLNGKRLIFSVENSVQTDTKVPFKSGLGLINLKKRLEILFSESYELVTMPEEGQFLAVLKFNIN
jgi:two-component system LytT family sensor kinase